MSNGKGSARRPTDEKAYGENWERIFRKDKEHADNRNGEQRLDSKKQVER